VSSTRHRFSILGEMKLKIETFRFFYVTFFMCSLALSYAMVVGGKKKHKTGSSVYAYMWAIPFETERSEGPCRCCGFSHGSIHLLKSHEETVETVFLVIIRKM
jgi:hypothetical protein